MAHGGLPLWLALKILCPRTRRVSFFQHACLHCSRSVFSRSTQIFCKCCKAAIGCYISWIFVSQIVADRVILFWSGFLDFLQLLINKVLTIKNFRSQDPDSKRNYYKAGLKITNRNDHPQNLYSNLKFVISFSKSSNVITKANNLLSQLTNVLCNLRYQCHTLWLIFSDGPATCSIHIQDCSCKRK